MSLSIDNMSLHNLRIKVTVGVLHLKQLVEACLNNEFGLFLIGYLTHTPNLKFWIIFFSGFDNELKR